MPAPTACSDPARNRLVVAEGMPGAGKTTTLRVLDATGHAVVGEYTDTTGATLATRRHPAVDDDAAHQDNWVRKARQAAVKQHAGPVFVDRDWTTALAYAYSIADGDAGTMLEARTRWAYEQLRHGNLAVADAYLVFDLPEQTSLARRREQFTRRTHPWNQPAALTRLRAYYADPPRAVARTHPELADAMSAAAWHHRLGTRPVEDAARFLRRLAGQGQP